MKRKEAMQIAREAHCRYCANMDEPRLDCASDVEDAADEIRAAVEQARRDVWVPMRKWCAFYVDNKCQNSPPEEAEGRCQLDRCPLLEPADKEASDEAESE